MKKSNIMLLVASAILIAGVLITGCTQDSGTATAPSGGSSSSVQTQITQAAGDPPAAVSQSGTSDAAKSGDRPKFNESAVAPSGTPPEGMMNGTHPSGTPPSGDGKGPSGTPPSGTPPSGTPPSGTPQTSS